MQFKATTDTMFFWDGKRKIDMVLAYEEEATGQVKLPIQKAN